MATNRDHFLNKLESCRNEINTKFKEVSENLITRQTRLLADLDNIEKKYTESRKVENEIEQLEKVKRELKKVLESCLIILKENVVTNVNDAIKNLDNEIADLRQKMVTYTNIDIELDITNINALIDKLGSVKLTQDNEYYISHVKCITNNFEISNPVQISNTSNSHIYAITNKNLNISDNIDAPPIHLPQANVDYLTNTCKMDKFNLDEIPFSEDNLVEIPCEVVNLVEIPCVDYITDISGIKPATYIKNNINAISSSVQISNTSISSFYDINDITKQSSSFCCGESNKDCFIEGMGNNKINRSITFNPKSKNVKNSGKQNSKTLNSFYSTVKNVKNSN